MTEQQRALFMETVWDYYGAHGRAMPWRQPEADGRFDPYKIMVSELMLQQTQVSRVVPKFQAFVERFPDVQVLAAAPLGDVLAAWSGLGYNRRAKFLHQAAQQIGQEFPQTLESLVRLPGIGPNTAGAILTYAYNQPLVFIETNIRTVYIHHFFQDKTEVSDTELEPLIAATVANNEEPRQWYWALMDYGAYLKQTIGNLSRASKTYTRQSTFHGSRRQLRGAVLRTLVAGPQELTALAQLIADDRLPGVLIELTEESMIRFEAGCYHLGS